MPRLLGRHDAGGSRGPVPVDHAPRATARSSRSVARSTSTPRRSCASSWSTWSTDGKYHLVVDMERVDFLDSTGLGVLVGGLKRVRAHDGSLRLVCTQERILKIFRITGLTKVFPIHASVDEALAQPTAS